MVALRGKEIDSYLARPDPGRPIILLYGPDAGLVRERAEALGVAPQRHEPHVGESDPILFQHDAGEQIRQCARR